MDSGGLPGGLPVPPGGGLLVIGRTTLVNGIQGRTYLILIPTTGGSGTLSACTIIAGSLPAGLAITISADPPTTAAVSFCKISGLITTVGPATVGFTVQATDTAANTATQVLSITVRTDFAVTTVAAFLDGVDGRTYGNPAAPDLKTPQPVVTSVSATVGNAPLTTCVFTVLAANPGFTLAPTSVSALPANTALTNFCPLSTNAAALAGAAPGAAGSLTAAGAFSVTLAATDSDILDTLAGQTTKIVVPAATKSSAALALTVQPALTLALAQATNVTPPVPLLNAVENRSYGVIGGTPTYTAAGGLIAAGTYDWCISVGPLPAGFAASPTALSACPTTAAIAVATAETVTATTAGAAGGPTAFTLQVADVMNAAVSSGAATAGTNLTINAVLSLAANFNDPMPDAVFGRTYGGVGFTSLVYTASGGEGAYAFTDPPTAGAPVAGSFPTPMACVAAATTLTCSSAPITGTVGNYTDAPASVDDAGNAAVAGSAAVTPVAQTATVTRDLTVRPEFTITTVTAFINGVIGRTYGNPAAPDLKTPQPVATDVSAAVGNAPLTACVFTVLAANPGFNLTPAPSAGNTCDLSSGAAALTASGAFTVALDATDSPITDPVSTGIVVPTNTISNSGAPLPITVDPFLALVLTQAGNATTPIVQWLDAVEGRSYGVIGGAPTWTATGGLSGTVNYLWCIVSSPALPPLFVTNPGSISTSCAAPTAIATATSVTLTSAAAGAAGSPYFATLQVSDPGNAAVPVLFIGPGPSLTINPPLAIAECSVSLAPCVGLGDPLPDAVVARPYGGAGFTPVTYQASGGVGAYAFTPAPTAGAPGAGSFPTPMACLAGATTLTCSSGAITGTAGLYDDAPSSVDDAGNAAVPGSAAVLPVPATATVTSDLTVQDPLTFAPGSPNYPNPLPDAVTGRSWGTGVGFTPLIYTVQDGLGGYSFALSGTAFPAGIACATAGATFTCDTTIAGTVTGAAGAYLGILVTPDDTANATTPSASTSATQPPAESRDLTVNDVLAVALQALSPDPTTAAGEAVVGRTYGAAPESPVIYEATGGLPAYVFSTSGTLLVNSNICAVPVTTATTLACDSGGLAVTGTTGSLTVQVDDTANATTPSGSDSLANTYTVNPAVSLSVAPDPESASSTAVVGRLYGAPAGLLSPTFTAAGGLSLFAFIHTGTLEGNTNIICTDAATTVTCESGVAVTAAGPFPQVEPFTLQVTDGGNLTTPADPVGDTLTKNFTINDALAITTASLPNGLVFYTYVPSGPGVTLATTGGLGGNTFVAGGAVGACAPAGSLPTGLALGAATGTLSGIGIVPSALVTDFTFDVCVFDTANTTTPSGTDTHVGYVVNILDTLAAVAQPGTDSVEGINTTTNVSVGPVAMPAGSAPTSVAVTPDGRKVYVTLNGTDDLGIIDTITGTATTIGGFALCTGPQGVAVGMPGGVPTAFVACSNRRIAVIDAVTDAILSEGIFGTAGATFYGVAFTPNEAQVYITDSTNDEFVVLNAVTAAEIALSPFTAGVTAPHGIGISLDGARVYIAGSASDDVIVLATADNTTVVAGPISTGLGSSPEALALTPSDAPVPHVFITLTGTDEFVVIDDSLATPAVAPARFIDPTPGVGAVRSLGIVTITTSAAHGFAIGQKVIVAGVADPSFDGAFIILTTPTPTTFTYAQVAADASSQGGTVGPIVSLALASSPFGVTIPPLLVVPATGVRAYIAQFSTNNVAIRNDETVTPFGANAASPIALTALSTPVGIGHIPVPR